MKLKDIAERIDEYLKKFELDPTLAKKKLPEMSHAITRFYNPSAHRVGRYVGVKYLSFQAQFNLNREEAERYLAWLDDGNKGKHFEMDRDGQ